MSNAIPAREFGPVSAEKMKTLAAILQDPNPIHWDVESVRALGMGERVVNQGPINMSFLVNTITAWTGDPGSLRALTIRYQANVFEGDTVRCEGEVAVDEDGLVTVEVRASVAGNPVVSGTARVART